MYGFISIYRRVKEKGAVSREIMVPIRYIISRVISATGIVLSL